MASDLESALLTALLDFARRRLDALLHNLAPDAEHLLLILPPGAGAADRAKAAGTDAGTHLTNANTNLTQLANAIATGPSSLAQCEAALAEATAALSEIDAAIRSIATIVPAVGDPEAAILTVVKAAVAAGGDTVTGLLDQIGLAGPISANITKSGTVLSYPLANAAEHPLDPASGAVLTLNNTSALATLDYGAARSSPLARLHSPATSARHQNHDEAHLQRRQHAHGRRRDTHQPDRSSGQQRGQRRLVDIPKRRMLTRDDVIHLVAMEAVST